MQISNWGKYPTIDAELYAFDNQFDVSNLLGKRSETIARGLGRSYGDSSLAHEILSTTRFHKILSFDDQQGILTCECGVSIDEVLKAIVPSGWFLPVVPGTKYVTIGGAIASDIHGKNHRSEGCFSDHVLAFDILLSEGSVLSCSRHENSELFKATCGGMGLTGLILVATLRLKRIETAYVIQKMIKSAHFTETLELLQKNDKYTYSVAWLDCLSRGQVTGRGIISLGEHASLGDIQSRISVEKIHGMGKRSFLSVPAHFPGSIMNRATIRIINEILYCKHVNKTHTSLVHYDSYFFPLDRVAHMNRIYGRRGFVQYQCVLPDDGKAGLQTILETASRSGYGSFINIIKLFGASNDNLLSFPMKGFTLAMDFPLHVGLFTMLSRLDAIVLDHGGRLYLTKDARMSANMFTRSYTNAERFYRIKVAFDKERKFQSIQSKRLGI